MSDENEDIKVQLAEVKTKVDTMKEDITEIKNNSAKNEVKIDKVTVSLSAQDIFLAEIRNDMKEIKKKQENFENNYIESLKKPTLFDTIGKKMTFLGILGGLIVIFIALIVYHTNLIGSF